MSTKSEENLVFEVLDHGVDNAQFFTGEGVALSAYAYVVTGCGTSARAAGEEALEQFYCGSPPERMSPSDAKGLQEAVNALSDVDDAHEFCKEPDEDCELYHYVSIRWR